MRRKPQGHGEALTGAWTGWVLSRERTQSRERRRHHPMRKATVRRSSSQDRRTLPAVLDPMHVQNLCARKPGDPTPGHGGTNRQGPHREPLRGHDGDVRTWEVGQPHSTKEVAEQGGPGGRGGGDGGKGAGQGERGRGRRSPDQCRVRAPSGLERVREAAGKDGKQRPHHSVGEPDARDRHSWPCPSGWFGLRAHICRPRPPPAPLRHYPRQEPGAVVPLAGICAGGGQQWPSLPRQGPHFGASICDRRLPFGDRRTHRRMSNGAHRGDQGESCTHS